MKNVMTYKGYAARIEFDQRDNIFVGKVVGIADSITFHGETVKELKDDFQAAPVGEFGGDDEGMDQHVILLWGEGNLYDGSFSSLQVPPLGYWQIGPLSWPILSMIGSLPSWFCLKGPSSDVLPRDRHRDCPLQAAQSPRLCSRSVYRHT